MRYLALATDYDGTLAHHGRVDGPTLAALERLLASGRKLLLVTGRELDDLARTFDHFELFEWIVAENGALLYQPAAKQEISLAQRPPDRFVEALKARGVGPISVGRAIVATWSPHETTVLEVIRDLGLELQVIFNKGAVMILPANVNKATGLCAALERMGLSAHNVVGVGDAENDHAFLTRCECSAAVANALPAVKETADVVTQGDHGAGVAELIDQLVTNDLHAAEGRLTRHHLQLGRRADGREERLAPFGSSVLIAGPSGSGKSTVASALLERFCEHGYQFCIMDPEGDYVGLEGAIGLGTGGREPAADEVVQALRKPSANVVVNLIGLPVTARPPFFLSLLPRLLELRASTGRPHWIVVDEAHHLLPASWEPALVAVPQYLDRLLLITVHPNEVSPGVVAAVDLLLAVGPNPAETLEQFCATSREKTPALPAAPKADDEILVWSLRKAEPPYYLKPAPGQMERHRHVRKYAEGELPPDRSFYFRGSEGKLNLRAHNLVLFLQMADGVDEDTWTHHLQQGDYSRWLRQGVKDDALAADIERIEQDGALSPAESRQQIRTLVEKRYTLPAASALPMPGTDAAPRWS